MRLRALPLLLVLTVGDYALWDWSIADGHDIVSLVSGLTLLPLAAASLALLVVGATRLLGIALELPARRRAGASVAGGSPAGTRASARSGAQSATSARPVENAGRERPSRRLAA